MIDHFQVGHWYRYIGPSERPSYFNQEGAMDYILDHEPHLCIASSSSDKAVFADDSGRRTEHLLWKWYIYRFEECDLPIADNDEIENWKALFKAKLRKLSASKHPIIA